MQNDACVTWKEAWQAGPGPRSWKEAVLLMLKGFCMGTADIIPGVSGGTIAFITGIYADLLLAVKSVDKNFLAALIRGELKKALAVLHARFLFPLLCGIGVAVVSVAGLMHTLMDKEPVLVWSVFFGLIAASAAVLLYRNRPWNSAAVMLLCLGFLLGWMLTGLVPVHTPETFVFIFFCGAIAISAMILPGISGAFLLLVLGKYAFITGALRAPFAEDHFVILCVFSAGCCVGIFFFSRLLSFILARYPGYCIALLTGLMAGALRKAWPWKEVLETGIIRGKEYVLHEVNRLPAPHGEEFFSAVGLMLAGSIAVITLEWIALRCASEK